MQVAATKSRHRHGAVHGTSSAESSLLADEYQRLDAFSWTQHQSVCRVSCCRHAQPPDPLTKTPGSVHPVKRSVRPRILALPGSASPSRLYLACTSPVFFSSPLLHRPFPLLSSTVTSPSLSKTSFRTRLAGRLHLSFRLFTLILFYPICITARTY